MLTHAPLAHHLCQLWRQLVHVSPHCSQGLTDLPLAVVPQGTPLQLAPVPQLLCEVGWAAADTAAAAAAAAAAATPRPTTPAPLGLLLPLLVVVLLLVVVQV